MNTEKFFQDFSALNSPVKILDSRVTTWKDKIKCKCLICGNEFYSTPANIKRGSIHKECARSKCKDSRKLSNEDFIQKLSKINRNVLVLEKYEKSIKPIKAQCTICKHIWTPTPNNLLRGHGCPKCHFIKISNNTNKNLKYNISKCIEKILLQFPYLQIPKEIHSLYTTIECSCQKCNTTWYTNLRNLMNIKSNNCCPFCSGRILDIEKLNVFLKEHKLKINSIPNKYSDNIDCECIVCGYAWNSKCNSLLKSKGCPKCLDRVRKTHDEFETQLKIMDIDVELLSTYVNAKTKIRRKCKSCGDISSLLPKEICKGVCKSCSSIKLHNIYAKTNEEFIKEMDIKYQNEYKLIDKYINANTKIKIKHKLCNNIFEFNPSRIYNDSIYICPYCYTKTSNGERVIQHYLDEKNILYKQHKTFPQLKGVNNGFLSYDFYLIDYNLLIEFQGLQHYEPIDRFGGQKRFEIQKEHDMRKRNYAKQNNFKLIEIPYWDFDKVHEILFRELINSN